MYFNSSFLATCNLSSYANRLKACYSLFWAFLQLSLCNILRQLFSPKYSRDTLYALYPGIKFCRGPTLVVDGPISTDIIRAEWAYSVYFWPPFFGIMSRIFLLYCVLARILRFAKWFVLLIVRGCVRVRDVHKIAWWDRFVCYVTL